MGDDELNFTEEESKAWAGDPRNQEKDEPSIFRLAALYFLTFLIIFLGIWLITSSNSTLVPEDPRVGEAPQLPAP